MLGVPTLEVGGRGDGVLLLVLLVGDVMIRVLVVGLGDCGDSGGIVDAGDIGLGSDGGNGGDDVICGGVGPGGPAGVVTVEVVDVGEARGDVTAVVGANGAVVEEGGIDGGGGG